MKGLRQFIILRELMIGIKLAIQLMKKGKKIEHNFISNYWIFVIIIDT